jgi:hypothetical protein
MKKILFACLLFLSVSFSVRQSTTFQQLYVLTGGVWVMKTSKGALCEEWKKQGTAKLSNRAFKVNGADTGWLETVDLEQKGNTITYTSTVKDQNTGKAVPFTLISSEDGKFVFSNPQHDFPQRIIYHFITRDSLHAWIEGTSKGKEHRSDFYYSRR